MSEDKRKGMKKERNTIVPGPTDIRREPLKYKSNALQLQLASEEADSAVEKQLAIKEKGEPFRSVCRNEVKRQHPFFRTLDLEEASFDTRERWITALHMILLRDGCKPMGQLGALVVAEVSSTQTQGPRARVSQGGVPSPSASSSAIVILSPTHTATSATSPRTSPSSYPSSVVALTALSVTPSLTNENCINSLQAGMDVTLFYTTPRNETLCAEIHLFMVTPLSDPSMVVNPSVPLTLDQLDLLHSNLHWCARSAANRSTKKMVEGQKIALVSVCEMKEGKGSPMLRSDIAKNYSALQCFQIICDNLVLNLCAQSEAAKDDFMLGLNYVIEKIKEKQKIVAIVEATASIKQASSDASGAEGNSPAPGVFKRSRREDSNTASKQLFATMIAYSLHGNTIDFSDPTNYFLMQSKIGEGSYGAVYTALDYRDGTRVAIKVLQCQGHDSLKLRKEIYILRQCHSPYIVGYKGAFQKGNNLWIVLEYCSSGSLSDVMQVCNKSFSEAQVACIMRDSLLGLQYLHKQKTIHRDIKGGNILLGFETDKPALPVCKLADFGVSSTLDKALGKNRTVIGQLTIFWLFLGLPSLRPLSLWM
jgi:hypothetical protein